MAKMSSYKIHGCIKLLRLQGWRLSAETKFQLRALTTTCTFCACRVHVTSCQQRPFSLRACGHTCIFRLRHFFWTLQQIGVPLLTRGQAQRSLQYLQVPQVSGALRQIPQHKGQSWSECALKNILPGQGRESRRRQRTPSL